MDEIVFDIECDGFNPTKIHCVAASINGGKVHATTDYEAMRKLFSRVNCTLICHNAIKFDIPVVERLLGVKVQQRIIDSLPLSWYLEPSRKRHGLEDWGEEFGVPKPKIDDWENLTPEEYMHRCSEDVKINLKLWQKQKKHLLKLYETQDKADRLIDYLTFKMECARDQEKLRWKLDVNKAETLLSKLELLKEEKLSELRIAMPPVVKYKTVKKPTKLYLKGKAQTLSKAGKEWFDLLYNNQLPEDYDGEVKVETSRDVGNPGSSEQVKSWLYSFGWVPETFKFDRNKATGDIRKIPQVNREEGKGICLSIKKLYPKEPNLQLLDGLGVLSHRIGLVSGFVKNASKDGYLQARIDGLTNTLRFKHAELVNLPGVDKPHGADIRGCLTAPEGYELCGSDQASLEDRTKQHYMWDYDPEYVKEMMTPDFDPHIDMAVSAKGMSAEDAKWFKNATEEEQHSERYKKLKAVRQIYKKVNYTAVYGAGGATLGRAAGVDEHTGSRLGAAYWKRNWSVKQIGEDQLTKKVLGQMWLFNPVSELWYSLRYEKDRFSTLNQGTGVWCFDTWVKYIKRERGPIIGQFHDEVVLVIRKGCRDKVRKVLNDCQRWTNEELKLNRQLDCSIAFGGNYAEIH